MDYAIILYGHIKLEESWITNISGIQNGSYCRHLLHRDIPNKAM